MKCCYHSECHKVATYYHPVATVPGLEGVIMVVCRDHALTFRADAVASGQGSTFKCKSLQGLRKKAENATRRGTVRSRSEDV